MPGDWDTADSPWRSVVDCISDGVAVVDTMGVQRFVNQALCDMLGFAHEELINTTAPFCYWPEEHYADIQRVLQASMAGDRSDFEIVLKRKSGERFPALVHPGVVEQDGKVLGYVATVKDITERRRMEQALSWSEQRWRSVAENPFDFVATIDRSYRYTYVNHTAPGVRAEDLVGKASLFDFIESKDVANVRDICEHVFRDAQAGSYETYVPSLRRYLLTIVGPIVENGVVTGASLLTRDVTTQRQAERALRQAQRMEALGRLAGGIAHDFNNLLVPIVGNADLLRSALTGNSNAESHLDDIERAAERARELVSRILVFGREPSLGRERVRMQDLVREVARFIATGAPANIAVHTCIDDRCLPVLGGSGELHQVVTNLCTNAIQALEQVGGTLTLTVEPAEILPANGTGRTHSPRPAVRIIVEDSGPGIPEDIQARIFDPFFTTRPVGQGTGLGLSIVHAVISRYEGSVSVESTPPSGARFTVLLPTVHAEHEKTPPPRTFARELECNRVLRLVCVDDEPLVLRWLANTLQLAGHTVTTFVDPMQAAVYLATHADELDCIISDETMPELSGTQLASQLEQIAPRLPVLLISGHPTRDANVTSRNVRKRLQKPLSRTALLDAILTVIA